MDLIEQSAELPLNDRLFMIIDLVERLPVLVSGEPGPDAAAFYSVYKSVLGGDFDHIARELVRITWSRVGYPADTIRSLVIDGEPIVPSNELVIFENIFDAAEHNDRMPGIYDQSHWDVRYLHSFILAKRYWSTGETRKYGNTVDALARLYQAPKPHEEVHEADGS